MSRNKTLRERVDKKALQYAQAIVSSYIKTKPKWVPLFLWRFGFRIYFNVPQGEM